MSFVLSYDDDVLNNLDIKTLREMINALDQKPSMDNGSELIKEELKKLTGVYFTFEIKITPFNLKDQNKSFTITKIFHIDRDIQIGGIHKNVQKDEIVIDQQDNLRIARKKAF
ncbi:hypothetical protein IFM89_010547 [Coptis chinensis]|uniref:Uncharacterized protein n=1 Tax=Coptis chinensis TaxID=261450 RepID=A0A835ISN7_9MAGN|nr:hypothetical protein IFM89_010547 [Coptis chinensis]